MSFERCCNSRLLALVLALGSLSLGAADAPSAAPVAYPPPATAETARVLAAFRAAAARSASDRGGDFFYLSAKYGYIVDADFRPADFAHLGGMRRPVRGTEHGNSWEYDTHIPLILWGPGFVKAGVRSGAPATQQDLVPTMARLMGGSLPEDASGRVLTEALLPVARHPRIVLTVVFDQVGEAFLAAHPGKTPVLDRLAREGARFDEAFVTHLDVETGIGHTAIGTGAWPGRTGIGSNNFWMRGFGAGQYSFAGESPGSPFFLSSPTLADTWLRQTDNRALVAALCYADRAAIGMAGHGSLFRGNKKPWVVFYDSKSGTLTTNPAYYQLPAYLAGRGPAGRLAGLVGEGGLWLGHAIDPKGDVRRTPAYAEFDGDSAAALLEHEPWGEDDVTDLFYVTFKASDAAGHAYGFESDEAGEVLAAQDGQLGRLLALLEAKAGRGNVVVAFTADHGSAPLTVLSGGSQLLNDKLVADLNARFGAPVVEFATAAQLYVNRAECRRRHVTDGDIERAIREYRVAGKPFFADVLSREAARCGGTP